MDERHVTNLILASTIVLTLAPTHARAQSSCRTDSASVARADSLILSVEEEAEDPGSRANSYIWTKSRRAVEAAPLSMKRWKVIYQLVLFLNRPDSAVALATLALKRWPRCAIGDSALVQAKALLARPRSH